MIGRQAAREIVVLPPSANSYILPVDSVERMFYNAIKRGGEIHMTAEEAYAEYLKMDAQRRIEFKAFISALLESEDSASLPPFSLAKIV